MLNVANSGRNSQLIIIQARFCSLFFTSPPQNKQLGFFFAKFRGLFNWA